MATKGFNGQWVAVLSRGKHTDNKGKVHDMDGDFIERVVANFTPDTHEPPVVIGHPVDNGPAYGWVRALRVNGDVLEAQFGDTDDTFEEMVKSGRFKKRSASLYLTPEAAPGGKAPALRHVGFLGAQPPAVKGLREITFGEGGASVFETDFNEGEGMKDGEFNEEQLAEGVFQRIKKFFTADPGKNDNPSPAAFSETQVKEMATAAANAAVETVKAEFTEKVTALETENAALKSSVAQLSDGSVRAEIIAFTERLGKAKFPPAFKEMGAVDFMERLATLPADQKLTVVSFTEQDGKTVETKTEVTPLKWFQDFMESMPSFVQFGEHFASLAAADNTDSSIDPARTAKINAELGIEGGAK